MSFALRFKLSAMMFLQFMLVAVFFVPLAVYLKSIQVEGVMIATIMATMAWGAILSPIVGMLADRLMNAEKVLFILNILVAAMLVVSATTQNHYVLFVCLLVAMCAYMPTWGLTSSIAITNSTPEAFPLIRVFGSIGWVCAAVFAIVAKWGFDTAIDGTAIPFYCGAGVAVIAAANALMLPKTAPAAKGQPMSIVDALGLKAFSMLKDKNTAVMMLCSCLWMVAFSIYWLFFSMYLDSALKVKDITATMNVGQISEMAFIALLPVAIKLFGMKLTMALGIFAMVLRYAFCAYALDVDGLYWGAIVVHGIIFGFFFVTAQMYMAKKAPKELQAQAQGLFFCLAFGVAQIVGAYFTNWLIDINTATLTAESVKQTANAIAEVAVQASVIDWKSVFLTETAISGVLLAVFLLFFKNDVKEG